MQASMIEGFHISPQQKHLWLLQQDSLAYRCQLAILIEGKLQLEILKEALNKLLNRHEILRTTFHSLPGVKFPIQSINHSTTLQWKEINLRNLDFEKDAIIKEIFTEEGQYPLDLEQEPIVRLTLLKSAQKYVLFLTLPALCADTRTLRNIVQEISYLYAIAEQNQLYELPIQYIQFSAWHNEILEEENTEIGTGYWKEKKIFDFLDLKLPFEAQPLDKPEFKPQFVALHLCPDTAARIKAFVQKHELSTFVFFLTCWYILLWRFTNKPDIVIGTICDGRSYEGLEEALGLFAKYLPVHCHLEDNDSFMKVLQQVDESIREAYAWQEYFAWEQIVGTSENFNAQSLSLFCFDFEQQYVTYSSNDVSFTIYKQYACFDRFKVKLSCIDKGGVLDIEFHYDSSLFAAQTIERLAGQFNTLLESVVSNSDVSISKLQILSAIEKHLLLVEWNDTKVEYQRDRCLHQLFETQVELTPDAIAVVFEEEQLTYRELNAKANQLTHYLQKVGVGPEVLVGICVERSLEMAIGLLGILKAGGACVPLDPAYPQERLAFMLSDSQVSVLLTQQKLLSQLPEYGAHVICLDKDWQVICVECQENPVSDVTDRNLAYVIYTSGSTGQPKGAMLPHQAICNHMLWMQKSFPLTETDKVLQKTSFSFDASIWEFYAPLLVGAQLIIARPGGHQDSAYLIQVIAEQKVTTLKLVPSLLRMLLEEKGLETCKSLKQFFCGAEVLPLELQERFFACLDADLHNLYGPTEATIDVTFWNCKRQSNLPIVPIGRPISNTQIYILNAQEQPVPIGVLGELHISGDSLARGYLNRPELTAEKFIPNPFSDQPGARLYKTGDIARYLPDGSIEYLGRIDRQVKIRGFRVELGEIEVVLSQYPAVKQVIVLAREDEVGNKHLVAYVVPKQESAPTTTELHRFLQEKLPNYMVPSAFVLLNALPLTVNGKVDRQLLPPPETLRPQLEVGYVMPRTEVEQTITAVWQKVLNLQKIGIHDNFFELGGNSLLIFQVHSLLRQRFQTDLSMLELFRCPTISSLGEYFSQLNNQVAVDFENQDDRIEKIKAGKTQRKKHRQKNTGGNYAIT